MSFLNDIFDILYYYATSESWHRVSLRDEAQHFLHKYIFRHHFHLRVFINSFESVENICKSPKTSFAVGVGNVKLYTSVAIMLSELKLKAHYIILVYSTRKLT